MSTGAGASDRLPPGQPLPEEDAVVPHVSLHAVLVRNGIARFEDEALPGTADFEEGVQWVASPGDLEVPERWDVVWTAVTHDADGTRAYIGLAADEVWIDLRATRAYRDAERSAALREAAREGRVELAGLDAAARAAVRRALLMRDPDAWDRARPAVQAALQPPPGARAAD